MSRALLNDIAVRLASLIASSRTAFARKQHRGAYLGPRYEFSIARHDYLLNGIYLPFLSPRSVFARRRIHAPFAATRPFGRLMRAAW